MWEADREPLRVVITFLALGNLAIICSQTLRKAQAKPEYDEHVTAAATPENGTDEDQEYDERYDDAVALITKKRQASISMIQRHLRIGYNRAARIIEVMEKEGVVGPSDGVKPREVLVSGYDDRE